MTSPLTRRLWLSGLGGSVVAAAADWKSAAFPNWSDDAVLRLLVDSPWAHSRRVRLTWYGRKEADVITYKDVPGTRPGQPASSTVQGGSPVGGIGSGKVRNKLPDSADLIFRWASALPVRQAKALFRLKQQQQGDRTKLNSMVESRPSSGYALEIFGLPTVTAHAGTEAISARLNKSAAIRTKAGRLIRAQRAHTEVTGEQLTSTIYFGREELLRFEDQEIECIGNADLFEFSERFRLRDMRYLDSLEI